MNCRRLSPKKRLEARRAANKALAMVDAKKRCGICKRGLPAKVFLRWGDPSMYCSVDCRDEAEERQ